MTTMGNPLPANIIVVFPFNPVNWITGELGFGNIQKLQGKLAVNVQAIQIPCNQISHAEIIYSTTRSPGTPPIIVFTID